MSSARLHGADHGEIGEIATVSETNAALVISRGGAPKRYGHKEPNEDSTGFRLSPWGAVGVVADGHHGSEAARVTLDRILDAHAPRWLDPSPIALDVRFASEAAEVVLDANAAILEAASAGRGGESRTTLSLVLLRPREGFLAALCVGDSHIFEVGASETRELALPGDEPSTYLGDPGLTLETLRPRVRTTLSPLDGTRAVVLATDGLSERGIGVRDPRAAVAEALRDADRGDPTQRALRAARGVAQRAMDAQRQQRSGDNIAVAVLWVG